MVVLFLAPTKPFQSFGQARTIPRYSASQSIVERWQVGAKHYSAVVAGGKLGVKTKKKKTKYIGPVDSAALKISKCHNKFKKCLYKFAVFRIRIRIRRIHMFLGFPDPHPDPLVRDMDPYPAPDHQAKIVRKTLIPTVM
jgi:hypothetical protein